MSLRVSGLWVMLTCGAVMVCCDGLATAEEKSIKIQDITLKTPETWQQQPPSNNMRLSQFVVPPVDGDKEPAEFVISFFNGDGGGAKPNVQRWVGQFQGADRKVKVTQGESPQGSYIFSDISGTYDKPIGPPIAGKKQPTPGQRSLGIILTVGGKGNYFLKLTGPEKTVAAAADALRASFGADAAKEKEFSLE